MALTDHCRVMVVGPSGMAADAITKAVAVLGPKDGLKLIDETPGMATMVTRRPAGSSSSMNRAGGRNFGRCGLKPNRDPVLFGRKMTEPI